MIPAEKQVNGRSSCELQLGSVSSVTTSAKRATRYAKFSKPAKICAFLHGEQAVEQGVEQSVQQKSMRNKKRNLP